MAGAVRSGPVEPGRQRGASRRRRPDDGRSALRLASPLNVTGAASFGPRQGIGCRGEGFGTLWLFNREVTADYAFSVETSGFGPVTAEFGEFGLNIVVRDRHVYTPPIERGNDVRSIRPRSRGLRRWHEPWRSGPSATKGDHKMTCLGGPIVPRPQIFSVDASGADPRSIQGSREETLEATSIVREVRPSQSSRGYIVEGAAELIGAVTDARQDVTGGAQPEPPSSEMSMWRDLNMCNEVGIPSACCGPPRQREEYSDARNRAIKGDDLIEVTEVYGLTALRLCGVA